MRTTLLLFYWIISLIGIAQTQTIIGTGNDINSSTNYPAPYGNWFWGARHQMLVRASELSAAGITQGTITALAFRVSSSQGEPLQGFSISIKSTNLVELGSSFQTGLTTVYSSGSFTEQNGWNNHTFSIPFQWDGTSNLIIQTCFNNNSYTANAQIYSSTTSFRSTIARTVDENDVCTATGNNLSEFYKRPNMRFTWSAPTEPPLADFSASAMASCDGNISFYDQSSNVPNQWLWDFGDGNSSNLANPTHTYSASGTYSVTLTSTNNYGSNTVTKTNFITVDLSSGTPAPASCTPQTLDGTFGFGITEVALNGFVNSSGNSSEGYQENTCGGIILNPGHSYVLAVEHPTPTAHSCAAWIDWNGNGSFEVNSETIGTNASGTSSSFTFNVPGTAVLDQPLRLRISGEYDMNGIPGPCTNLQYGQAEDYAVLIKPLTEKPSVAFSATPTNSCNGDVQFKDLSTNLPYSWRWDFGDGNSSIAQNPLHHYTSDGYYDVSLMAENNFGVDTLLKTEYIRVQADIGLTPVNCIPNTLDYCCGYGIFSVKLAGLQKTSSNASEGYQDFSCDYGALLAIGSSYNIQIKTGIDNPQDTKAWIDFNDDGQFADNEVILEKLSHYNPSQNFVVPSNGVTLNKNLRMRILSDEVGSSLSPCSNPMRGQVEDYTVNLSQTSITENNLIRIKIYPNPAKEEIWIKSEQIKFEKVKILNLVGQEIYSEQANSEGLEHKVPTEYFPNGQYLIQITTSENLIITEKIIIQN